MSPSRPLPLSSHFQNPETYVEALLSFATTSDLFITLCGGVHVLDFLTSIDDPYTTLVPEVWRDYFDALDIDDIVYFLVKSDLTKKETSRDVPSSLIDYVKTVRSLCLDRQFPSPSPTGASLVQDHSGPKVSPTQILSRQLAVGMNPKKKHEVSHFCKLVDELATYVSERTGEQITHLVDFGAGHNYLGRALASEPYCRNIIALERRDANIKRAGDLDIKSKVVDNTKVRRNKKLFRSQQDSLTSTEKTLKTLAPDPAELQDPDYLSNGEHGETTTTKIQEAPRGTIEYVQTEISKESLENWVPSLGSNFSSLMIMSLHSCGNLVHHGLRSITLNPAVRCVAMVGCCYNLLTERLASNAPSYKIKGLRSKNERVDRCGSTKDADGFPMSNKLINYHHAPGGADGRKGITFNITARMMACQAPENWTSQECAGFFTRHFYRALLQRIFVDKGAVPSPMETYTDEEAADRVVIIGSLRPACYKSFLSYVRGALVKMSGATGRGPAVVEMLQNLTDEEIKQYEERYQHRKKHLSIMWSLMAFSAGVVESIIVVDRWLWLREQQDVVDEAWVESVFEYSKSPRNLVVVGIKKT